MTYRGSCHCGRIAYEVEGEPEQVITCNCSMCQRRGSMLWFVPRDHLKLLTPEENLSTYTFNTHKIKNYFCNQCGIQPFGEGVDPSGNAMAAVNARCLEGIDLDSLKVHHYDGRSA
ncbi:GFA family protein [Saccharospirillum salsuginis]|uniref:Aldehyde-activating protein n=1 Tax=Saccharospirillum salsuginis TaxID=418750 RepID=A0A918K2K5_9GAMM|nr:GFA family protein [Saccharospirillum salsuginis]GGX43480.1 aldehyde-activating protein [Saccharospirillum salsuginis]